jgi:hypothetical protein
MRTTKLCLLLVGLAAVVIGSAAQPLPASAPGDTTASPTTTDKADAHQPALRPGPAMDPGVAPSDTTPTEPSANNGTDTLSLNFRGAPLGLVLDYLSDVAGFIINKATEVKGTVDV